MVRQETLFDAGTAQRKPRIQPLTCRRCKTHTVTYEVRIDAYSCSKCGQINTHRKSRDRWVKHWTKP